MKETSSLSSRYAQRPSQCWVACLNGAVEVDDPGSAHVDTVTPTLAGRARNVLRGAFLLIPIPVGAARRAAEAQRYWTSSTADHLLSDSHRRDSHFPDGVATWERIGRLHLEYFREFARANGTSSDPGRVLEWGAGGGANAVTFAPAAQEFIAVEVSPESLAECGRQVREVCETTYTPILVGADSPEDAVAQVDGSIDLFLCFYVMELLPSQAHGRRVLEVAARLLRPGGTAIVQIKYQTSSLRTRSRTWSYTRQFAAMTSYPIDKFWAMAAETGFTPQWIRLVPQNELDERYAYFFLTRN